MSKPSPQVDIAESVLAMQVFHCRTFISGAVVPPFKTARGDVVSGSHVLGCFGALSDNGAQGCWQEAAGTYVIETGLGNQSNASADGAYFVNHQMLIGSGTTTLTYQTGSVSLVVPPTAKTIGLVQPNFQALAFTRPFVTQSIAFAASSSMPPTAGPGGVPGLCFPFAIYSGSSTSPVDPAFDFEVDTTIFFSPYSIFSPGL